MPRTLRGWSTLRRRARGFAELAAIAEAIQVVDIVVRPQRNAGRIYLKHVEGSVGGDQVLAVVLRVVQPECERRDDSNRRVVGCCEHGAGRVLRVEIIEEAGDSAPKFGETPTIFELDCLRVVTPLLDEPGPFTFEVGKESSGETTVVQVTQKMSLPNLYAVGPGDCLCGLASAKSVASVDTIERFVFEPLRQCNGLSAPEFIESAATLHAPFGVPGCSGMADEEKAKHKVEF